MSISLYTASVPLLTGMLANLSHILDKAQAFVDQKKIDPTALTQYRLAPDMLPFTRQILIACDAAKNGAARLSGITAPVFEDTESTLAELKARIQKTQDFLATVTPAQLDGREEVEIAWPVGRDKVLNITGLNALRQMVLPNFFFHISMAYAILRHNGVELGKRDYLFGAAG